VESSLRRFSCGRIVGAQDEEVHRLAADLDRSAVTAQLTRGDVELEVAKAVRFGRAERVPFHRGGTISESAGSLAFAPGQRTPGHGTWNHKDKDSYRQQMIALVLFTTAPNLPGTPGFDPAKPVSPGFQAGWLTVSHTVELADAAFYEGDVGAAFRRPQFSDSACSLPAGQACGCSATAFERRRSTPRKTARNALRAVGKRLADTLVPPHSAPRDYRAAAAS
jgi:hypothetical protein